VRGLTDACFRTAFRIGFPLVNRWTRKSPSVMMAIWVGDTVLIVRHSYRKGLSLPGGGIKKSETDFRVAAARELMEEVGLDIDPTKLIWQLSGTYFHLYEAELETVPILRIDRREIIFAQFLPASLLLAGSHNNTKVLNYLTSKMS
jgi:8-oxo-dGTP diphosphatase